MVRLSLCRFVPASIAALVLAGLATAAQANDRDLRATTIPATDCQLANGSASLGRASWIVGSGFGTLVCGLPLNNIDLGGTTNDNDITKLRVHYRDSDGAGGNAELLADLYHVKVSAGSRVTTSVCTFGSSPATTNYTTTTVPCLHDVVGGGAFYNVEIVMVAASGSEVEFIGIDFPR